MKDLTEHVKRRARRERLFWRWFPLIGGAILAGLLVLVLWLLGA